MEKLKLIIGLAVIGLAVFAVWQVGSCELANIELRGDLRDLAAQVGGSIGLDAPSSDEDVRNDVIRKASRHDIRSKRGANCVSRRGLYHPRESVRIFLPPPFQFVQRAVEYLMSGVRFA